MRWPALTRAAFLVGQIKSRLGLELGLNIWERLAVINRFEEPRPMPDPDTLGVLRAFFAPDIGHLGVLLSRDLHAWLDSGNLRHGAVPPGAVPPGAVPPGAVPSVTTAAVYPPPAETMLS